MSELLMGDEFDRLLVGATKIVLEEQDSISGTELAFVMNELGYNQVDPIGAGQWLKKTRSFRRHRRHYGNCWTPTRKYKGLLEEYGLD